MINKMPNKNIKNFFKRMRNVLPIFEELSGLSSNVSNLPKSLKKDADYFAMAEKIDEIQNVIAPPRSKGEYNDARSFKLVNTSGR